MADDKKQPIVIKKIVKGGGHHGGAWKVAYADFVTAMMAFFLLLWLLGLTDEEQRGGISEYFKAESAIQGPGGASTSMIKLGGTQEMPRGDGEKLNKKANSDTETDKAETKDIEKQEIIKSYCQKIGGCRNIIEGLERRLAAIREILDKFPDQDVSTESISAQYAFINIDEWLGELRGILEVSEQKQQ